MEMGALLVGKEYTIIVRIIWSGDRRRAALVWAAQPFLSSIQQALFSLDQDILTYSDLGMTQIQMGGKRLEKKTMFKRLAVYYKEMFPLLPRFFVDAIMFLRFILSFCSMTE